MPIDIARRDSAIGSTHASLVCKLENPPRAWRPGSDNGVSYRSGAFLEFCTTLGPRVVTEFNYRLSGRACAEIFVGFAIRSRDDAAQVAAQLRTRGYDVADLTENEVAKLHARHMVGGRARDVEHERVCRFEFPERPGALLQFLQTLGGRWNISLFHYRNHGADFGRVFAGFEVREQDLPAFNGFLEATGYWYQMELENEAYRRFLVDRG